MKDVSGRAPISVVIPTLNAADRLPACLEALVAACVGGLVREVVVVDGGSGDATREIADGFGATVLTEPPSRGGQLKAGGGAAEGDWLLFLHGDTVLAGDWASEAQAFIEAADADARGGRAGVFTLAFDAAGFAPRFVAAGAMARTHLLKSPYGDQGLLLSRRLYEAVGGFKDMPLFEDVDIVRRITRRGGRGALHVLKAKATTSAARYERGGYMRRVVKNAWLLMRYHAGASPEKLKESYR